MYIYIYVVPPPSKRQPSKALLCQWDQRTTPCPTSPLAHDVTPNTVESWVVSSVFGKDIDLMGESSRWGLENQIATIVTIPVQTDLFKKIHLHLTYTKIWNCHKMFMIWLSYWMISLITPFLRLKQLLCALIVPFYQTFLGIHYRQTLSAIHWKSELSQQETSLPTRFTMKRCFWGPPPCDQTVLL